METKKKTKVSTKKESKYDNIYWKQIIQYSATDSFTGIILLLWKLPLTMDIKKLCKALFQMYNELVNHGIIYFFFVWGVTFQAGAQWAEIRVS